MLNLCKKSSGINPQREGGTRKIANEVFQALMKAKLTGATRDWRFVVRIGPSLEGNKHLPRGGFLRSNFGS